MTHAEIEWREDFFAPGRLWSLLKVLKLYGVSFMRVASAITDRKHALREIIRSKDQHKVFRNKNREVDSLRALYLSITNDLESLDCEDLCIRARAISSNLDIGSAYYRADNMLAELVRFEQAIFDRLQTRYFYFMESDHVGLYGQPHLFGEIVSSKFEEARDDIESAGNCLAFNEPTAAVLHMVRAMETALRKLGRKIGATINAKDTWGTILNSVDAEIKRLPDKTEFQKKRR